MNSCPYFPSRYSQVYFSSFFSALLWAFFITSTSLPFPLASLLVFFRSHSLLNSIQNFLSFIPCFTLLVLLHRSLQRLICTFFILSTFFFYSTSSRFYFPLSFSLLLWCRFLTSGNLMPIPSLCYQWFIFSRHRDLKFVPTPPSYCYWFIFIYFSLFLFSCPLKPFPNIFFTLLLVTCLLFVFCTP